MLDTLPQKFPPFFHGLLRYTTLAATATESAKLISHSGRQCCQQQQPKGWVKSSPNTLPHKPTETQSLFGSLRHGIFSSGLWQEGGWKGTRHNLMTDAGNFAHMVKIAFQLPASLEKCIRCWKRRRGGRTRKIIIKILWRLFLVLPPRAGWRILIYITARMAAAVWRAIIANFDRHDIELFGKMK